MPRRSAFKLFRSTWCSTYPSVPKAFFVCLNYTIAAAVLSSGILNYFTRMHYATPCMEKNVGVYLIIMPFNSDDRYCERRGRCRNQSRFFKKALYPDCIVYAKTFFFYNCHKYRRLKVYAIISFIIVSTAIKHLGT